MADGFITRKGGGGSAPLEILDQEVISGVCNEPIVKNEPVTINKELEEVATDQVFDLNGSFFITTPTEMVMSNTTDTYLVNVGNGFDRIDFFKRDGTAFNKLNPPDVLPPSTCYSVTFSYNDDYVAVGHRNFPFVTIYKRDEDELNKLPNPSTTPPHQVNTVVFSPDDTYLYVGHFSPPFLTIYKRDGDVFNALVDPFDVDPTQQITSLDISSCGNYLVCAISSLGQSPVVWKRDGDSFNRVASPLLPDNQARAVGFSPNAEYLVSLNGHETPLISFWKRDGDNFNPIPAPVFIPTLSFTSWRKISFDPTGEYMIFSYQTDTRMETQVELGLLMYKRTGDVFDLVKIPEAESLISSSGHMWTRFAGFNNTGEYVLFSTFSNMSNNERISVIKINTTLNNPPSISINKAGNLNLFPWFALGQGYALESGETGDTIEIMSLFRKGLRDV